MAEAPEPESPVVLPCCQGNSEADRAGGASACPACGEVGRPIRTITLKHLVKPGFVDIVARPGFLICAKPNCEVLYFHADGARITKTDVTVRVGFKERDEPILLCYCFGFTQ